MKTVIALIVYDRLNNIKEWIRCFKLCDTQEAELIVIHNYKNKQDIDICQKICTDSNIKYISRENVGLDIGAFQDVCNERLSDFPNDWDYIFWITDDVYPMNKQFISYFLKEIQNPDVGVACLEISEEVITHIRTTGFIISKDTSLQLTFPCDPVITQTHCYEFEHGVTNNFLMQILKMNKKAVQVSTTVESSYLWDTHRRFTLINRWEEFYKTFPK